ncbi:MAG: PAS domain-containing sensor histidine kinase [Bdellovibrionota bacterium]
MLSQVVEKKIYSSSVLMSILENAPLPIGIYEGPDHRFVFINKAGTDAIRMKKEEVLGKTYAEVLPHTPERIASIDKVFETGIPFTQNEMELTIGHDSQGKPINQYINFLSQPYKNEEGNVLGVASFGVLVTAEVEARNKLKEESHRTTQILDNLSAGFFSLDRNWIFTYANPASQTALGLPPSEIVGKHVWTLHPQLVNSEFYHAYHRSMNERVVVEVTNYYPEQDRWYHTTSYPLDEGIAVSFTDITVRKKAEAARSLSDERFHTLTEAMPQMVWITDSDGNVVYFNRQWMKNTGTSLEENLDAGWLNVLHPDDRDRAFKVWNAALISKEYDVEYRIKMADGSYRWHVARGVPTIGDDGKIKQWVGTTTDIQSQKQTQVDLENAVKARDEFLSVASHELKTPLTVIQLQSELTKRSNDLNVVAKTTATIQRNVSRLTRVVDDMLDISRVATGKLNLELENLNLNDVVLETVERMTPLLKDSGCELIYRPGETVFLPIDKFRIEQVLVNLLTNTSRYGKGKPVFVTTSRNENFALLSVKDSGSGIAPADHERIFERFERATSNAGISGLGLGLYIVKNIVQLHKGSIRVESSIGLGAEFIVELPLKTTQKT